AGARHRPLDGGDDADVPAGATGRAAGRRPRHPQGRTAAGPRRGHADAPRTGRPRRALGALPHPCRTLPVAHRGLRHYRYAYEALAGLKRGAFATDKRGCTRIYTDKAKRRERAKGFLATDYADCADKRGSGRGKHGAQGQRRTPRPKTTWKKKPVQSALPALAPNRSALIRVIRVIRGQKSFCPIRV